MFDASHALPGLDARQVGLVESFAELLATPPEPGAPVAMASWLRAHAAVRDALDGAALGATDAFDASLAWAADGARTAAAWIVSNTGSARTAAAASVRTAKLARRTPLVAAAAADGALSADKVFWLVRARADDVAEVFDRDEADLVAQARTVTVDALRVRLATWRLRALEELARNEPDGDPPLPETEADRIDLHETIGGRGLIDGELDPASRALLFGAISAEIDAWFRDGDLTDDDRSRGELNAKALLDLVARGAAGTTEHGAPRPLLIALADAATLADLGIDLDVDVDHLIDALRRHQAQTTGSTPPAAHGPEAREHGIGARPDGPAPPGVAPDDPHDDDPTDDGPPGSDPPPDRPPPDRRPGGDAARPPGPPSPSPSPTPQPQPQPPPPSGAGPPERRCEIVGVGPIPVSRLAELLEHPVDVLLVMVAGDGTPLLVGRTRRIDLGPDRARHHASGTAPSTVGSLALLDRLPPALGNGPVQVRPRARIALVPAPLDLGRTRRLASAAQWRALLVRSGGRCEIPGCTVPSTRVQAHHLRYWEVGGPTDLANLLLVCNHDHHLLHGGFTVSADGIGARLHRPDGTPIEVPFCDRVDRASGS